MQYLHVDDLADAVVLAWERRLSGVYNVAPDTGVREDEARALAGGVAKVTLPARLAHAVAAWTWQLWRRGVPVEARAYATHPWVVAPDRLKAAGWTPHYSSEEAIVATDMRVHWDDLPPGRRQNYNLLLAIAGAVALVGGRGRRRRRPGGTGGAAPGRDQPAERGAGTRRAPAQSLGRLVRNVHRGLHRFALVQVGDRHRDGPGSAWRRAARSAMPLEVTGWPLKAVMMSLGSSPSRLAGLPGDT